MLAAATLLAPPLVRWRLEVTGAVQGVGFRPFVYRLARELALAGQVRNTATGATIEVEGLPERLAEFSRRLDREKPAICFFASLHLREIPLAGDAAFVIAESGHAGAKQAALLPDLAPCADCLAEIADAAARRAAYPFTNCTHCGPRYSILTGIPYDRPNTTMASFTLCQDCEREYSHPGDRRFHAQPIACPRCGPHVDATLETAGQALRAGQIVALKGVGGFQLLADARSSAAVALLRQRKHREAKPLAVMFPSLDLLRRYCMISPEEEALLVSPAAPIVLVKPAGEPLAPEVARGSPWLGAMLPSSPLHHLLLQACGFPVVATSGNRSDEPIAIDNDEARDRLGPIADCFLTHNRPIARPCDDSVTRLHRGRPVLLRRARGYAPLPVAVPQPLPRVLALGAHQKSSVAIALGRQVVLSQHLGDLDTVESRRAFAQAIGDLERLYDFRPELVVCDLHPDYYSTYYAESLGLPLLRVQHHHAHAAACAAENGLTGPYLAVTWDGTGYGLDGSIWGGEFFLVRDGEFERVAHLRPFPLPGGEAAARDCRRVAVSLLLGAHLDPARAGHAETALLAQMVSRGIQSPLTTSAGRLFDGLAVLAGVATRNAFEGQAPMQLEAAITGTGRESYSGPALDWRPLVEQIVAEPDPTAVPRRVHNTLAHWILAVARQTGVRRVVLSGGAFQNAYLAALVEELLEEAGFICHTHRQVPANDGGLALGQAALAFHCG